MRFSHLSGDSTPPPPHFPSSRCWPEGAGVSVKIGREQVVEEIEPALRMITLDGTQTTLPSLTLYPASDEDWPSWVGVACFTRQKMSGALSANASPQALFNGGQRISLSASQV